MTGCPCCLSLALQNLSEQHSLVQQMVAHPAVKADDMHKVADEAQQHPQR